MTEIICEQEEEERAAKALEEILTVLNKNKLRTRDLVLLYGNLGYSIGASIEEVEQGKGPTVEELQKSYYQNPTVGTALMLQGMLTSSWYDSSEKKD